MSRTWSVVKREFTEMVRTKAFLIGTVLGPLLMVGLLALQVLMMRGQAGDRTIAIVAEGGDGIARGVVATLTGESPDGSLERRGTHYGTEVIVTDAGDADALRQELLARIQAEELDGYLWLPAAVIDGEAALYEGRNATSFNEMAVLEAAVQTTVQGVRLRASGIDPARVAAALRPVRLEARKVGDKAASGAPEALLVLTYMIGFAIYMVVILYGNAIMRGVLEEKRDRIVEVIVSSIRAEQLMVGKVAGIGAAGVFQLLIWIGFAGLGLTRGGAIAARFGATLPELPEVPASVGVVFLFFFFAGFFVYAGLYAAMGAIATTDQEAQQLQFPVIIPLIVAITMMGAVVNDAGGTLAVVGSLVPLTAPVVMPMRAAISEVPLPQLAASMVLVVAAALALLWISARIYRVGILATGKRPTPAELWRWLRMA